MGAGNYYAIVIPPPDWGISPRLGRGRCRFRRRAHYLPREPSRPHAGHQPSSTHWRQTAPGTKASTTAVASPPSGPWWPWTTARPSLGRFLTSHGLPRRNIVRVNADGGVDTSFTPGSGFDGEVRSLALRSDGQIVAGGSFTSYNGKAANGVALISSNGASNIPLPTPDAAMRALGRRRHGRHVYRRSLQ